MATDYISREAAIKILRKSEALYRRSMISQVRADMIGHCIRLIGEVPTADIVSHDYYDRILAENDMMREQLAGIGKKPGDRMDDVRPAVSGRWIRKDSRFCYACSECGEMWAYHSAFKFCPNCGADMRPTTKGGKAQ